MVCEEMAWLHKRQSGDEWLDGQLNGPATDSGRQMSPAGQAAAEAAGLPGLCLQDDLLCDKLCGGRNPPEPGCATLTQTCFLAPPLHSGSGAGGVLRLPHPLRLESAPRKG